MAQKDREAVLLADAAGVNFKWSLLQIQQRHLVCRHAQRNFENPGCIGFHLCGAYQRNKSRRRGLLDEMENPDEEHVSVMTAANKAITEK